MRTAFSKLDVMIRGSREIRSHASPLSRFWLQSVRECSFGSTYGARALRQSPAVVQQQVGVLSLFLPEMVRFSYRSEPVRNRWASVSRRCFGTRRYRKKKSPKEEPKRPPPKPKLPPAHIQARPPGESPTPPLQFPDKDKENELSSLQVEVQTLYKEGNYSKALSLAKDLLESSKSHFGESHPATAAAHMNCGLQRKQLGYFDEARRDYNAAKSIYSATVGRDHQSYAAALHNIAVLNYQQVHVDTSLRATDRLSLVETALDALQTAHRIRSAELGADHPHTVATRSRWGATLAAQVLHHHKMQASGKRWYVSLLPTTVTETAWQAAEDHLRAALQTAVDTPRGQRIEPTEGQNIQTLSASAAAQNLAVVLKARATTMQTAAEQEADALLDEADRLYQQVLLVYKELLPTENHPDVTTAQHSWAELLEYRGDTDRANAIRQRIVDAYGDIGEEEHETQEEESVELSKVK